MIREEVPTPFTDSRSRIGVSCSTLCRVIRKLRTRADYPKKVLSSLRLDGVDRRFTSDWDEVSRTNAERTTGGQGGTEGGGRGSERTKAEKPRKRRRGSRKASWEGEIGQEQASGRQIKRSDGAWNGVVGREEEEWRRKRRFEIEEDEQKPGSTRALGKLKRFSLSSRVLATEKGSWRRRHTSRLRRRSTRPLVFIVFYLFGKHFARIDFSQTRALIIRKQCDVSLSDHTQF